MNRSGILLSTFGTPPEGDGIRVEEAREEDWLCVSGVDRREKCIGLFLGE